MLLIEHMTISYIARFRVLILTYKTFNYSAVVSKKSDKLLSALSAMIVRVGIPEYAENCRSSW